MTDMMLIKTTHVILIIARWSSTLGAKKTSNLLRAFRQYIFHVDLRWMRMAKNRRIKAVIRY